MKLALQILVLFALFEAGVVGVAYVTEQHGLTSLWERMRTGPSNPDLERLEPLLINPEQFPGSYCMGDDLLELDADGSYVELGDWGPSGGYDCLLVPGRKVQGRWRLENDAVTLSAFGSSAITLRIGRLDGVTALVGTHWTW
jgi:hypothetical protein